MRCRCCSFAPAAVAIAVLVVACAGDAPPIDGARADRGPVPTETAPAACNADSCSAGCCEQGRCELWSAGRCGLGGVAGEACVSCTGVCQEGRCVKSGDCGPGNCAGCCEGGTCLGGTQLSACGKAGVACTMCVPPKRCTTGSCK